MHMWNFSAAGQRLSWRFAPKLLWISDRRREQSLCLVPELSSEDCKTLLALPLASSPPEGRLLFRPVAWCVMITISKRHVSSALLSWYLTPRVLTGEGGGTFTTSPLTVDSAHGGLKKPSRALERRSYRVALEQIAFFQQHHRSEQLTSRWPEIRIRVAN